MDGGRQTRDCCDTEVSLAILASLALLVLSPFPDLQLCQQSIQTYPDISSHIQTYPTTPGFPGALQSAIVGDEGPIDAVDCPAACAVMCCSSRSWANERQGLKRQLCACVFAFVTLQVCFELPIVIVSPTNTRLPKDPCLQKPPPSLDCMKEPVEAIVEVVDHADGSPNCFLDAHTSAHLSSVHYRGQSSLHFSKHQMGVTLSEPTTFLGFPADRQFVLNGPMIDSTLLRNHLAHWLFRQTTRYSPRTRHVVLYVRDREDPTDFTPDYKGIYLALEKISYGPNRVGLAPLDNTCHGSELSGGWGWQINPLNYGVYSPNIVRDQYETAFGSGERPALTYPRPSVLTQSMRDYFVDPQTSPLSQLYKYLYENMTSPAELETHVDIGSFVDYFLHSEMSQNTDAYRRSTYFFKDRDQPINAGPVWDFNLAYGKGANQKDWLYKPHTFWKRLFCNYKFATLVQKRWRKLRAKLWSDLAIHAFIHESAAPIHRQLQKCANWTSADLYCANVQVGGTYHDNVHALATTVVNRAKWMDENVHQFYMKLNESVCVPVGTLPAFNCAANGSDNGCLKDPKKYVDAVEFPEVRKPSPSTPCAKFTGGDGGGGSGNGTLEPPSLDPCWLAVGVNVAQSSLMPFCSGYGFCEPGPAATCKCVPGHQPPTCADPNAHNPVQVIESKAFASPSELQPLPPQSIVLSEYFMWGYIAALMCAVCGCVSLYYRKMNCRIDDATSSAKFADARNVAVHYGT